MTKEELLSVFKWLEFNANKENLFYFKLNDGNEIGAYFKDTNKLFAQFYIKQILKIIDIQIKSNKKIIKIINI